jgi:hypothetical protein
LTKKRGNSLDTYSAHITNNSHNPRKTKTIIPLNEHAKSVPKPEVEEVINENSIVKQWLGERFKDKLQRASRLSSHTHKPILLYRRSIEESESAIEEEISYISGSHIVQVIYAYGGFIPSNFKNIEVFTVDKFTKWMLQESRKELLLQCIEELEQ